jgi:flagellar hook-length control protein FliK
LDNLPALRDRLAEQNIKVERFDVDVRDERRQPSGEQFAGQRGGEERDQQPRRAFQTRARVPSPTVAPRSAANRGDSSELNIVI